MGGSPEPPGEDERRGITRTIDRRRLWTAIAIPAALLFGLALLALGEWDLELAEPTSRLVDREDPERGTKPMPADGRAGQATASLDMKYDACAKAAGFDPGGVQVVIREGETTPAWVKTGRDVPTAIHRPCFAEIGGADQNHSSHGHHSTE